MSLNKVQIIGNVGNITIKDVKGVKVANLSVATNERAFKTKSGKEVPEHTEWHRVVLWRNLAEVALGAKNKGVEGEFVEKKKYMEKDEFLDMVAIAESMVT